MGCPNAHQKEQDEEEEYTVRRRARGSGVEMPDSLFTPDELSSRRRRRPDDDNDDDVRLLCLCVCECVCVVMKANHFFLSRKVDDDEDEELPAM